MAIVLMVKVNRYEQWRLPDTTLRCGTQNWQSRRNIENDNDMVGGIGRRGRRVFPSTSVIGGYMSYVTGMYSGGQW